MATDTATWSCTLDTECPKCKHDFDMLEEQDFWDGTEFEICEHHTERTRGIDAVCPECSHEFKVDFEY